MTLNTVQTAQRQRAITGGYKKLRDCCQDFLQDPEGEDFKVLDRNKLDLQSTESSPSIRFRQALIQVQASPPKKEKGVDTKITWGMECMRGV